MSTPQPEPFAVDESLVATAREIIRNDKQTQAHRLDVSRLLERYLEAARMSHGRLPDRNAHCTERAYAAQAALRKATDS